MRGMIKWKPFNSIISKKDLIEIETKINNEKITDTNYIIKIDNTIKTSLQYNLDVTIKYFKNGKLYNITGKIEHINIIEKYILINNNRIYFKNLINIDTIS